jgi:hypothetical protein
MVDPQQGGTDWQASSRERGGLGGHARSPPVFSFDVAAKSSISRMTALNVGDRHRMRFPRAVE